MGTGEGDQPMDQELDTSPRKPIYGKYILEERQGLLGVSREVAVSHCGGSRRLSMGLEACFW